MYRKKLSAALALLIVCSSSTPTHAKWTNRERDYAATFAIGAAAFSGLAYAAYWFFSASDEDVLHDAHSKFIAYKNDYAAINNTLSERMKTSGITEANAQQFAQNIDENSLYALAVTKHQMATIAVYHRQLSSSLLDLQSHYDELQSRIPGQKDLVLQDTMRSTADNIKNLIESLSLLDRIFTLHKAYFTLYEFEAKMGAKYAEEFKVLADYYGNQYSQEEAIRRYIISQSSTSSLPFPRVEYLKRIERDITTLISTIERASFGYPSRLGSAQHYLATLKAIKSYILTDAQYREETVQYERDQREKERLRIEREKADIERRKALAAERQARAEQEKADAKYREAYARERAARAQEESNRINRAKQNNAQTIHVVHY